MSFDVINFALGDSSGGGGDEHALEHIANKTNEINDSNKTSTELYPSVKAVYDLFASIVNGNEVSY